LRHIVDGDLQLLLLLAHPLVGIVALVRPSGEQEAPDRIGDPGERRGRSRLQPSFRQPMHRAYS
jgi:hypothetical protein